MVLYERGLLGIDDLVLVKWYSQKEFKIKGQEDRITVRHLLQHSAGWTRDQIDPMFNIVRNGKTLDELLQWVLDIRHLIHSGNKLRIFQCGILIPGSYR